MPRRSFEVFLRALEHFFVVHFLCFIPSTNGTTKLCKTLCTITHFMQRWCVYRSIAARSGGNHSRRLPYLRLMVNVEKEINKTTPQWEEWNYLLVRTHSRRYSKIQQATQGKKQAEKYIIQKNTCTLCLKTDVSTTILQPSLVNAELQKKTLHLY